MSNGSVLLEDVWPRQLSRAREIVVAQHPDTATAPAALPPDRLEALRRKVESTAGERGALESLAVALSPREVRALVAGLEQWTSLRADVAFLLISRARRSLVGPLWRSWQRFPDGIEVRSLLLNFAEQFGWEEAVEPAYALLVDQWVRADDPGVAIQGWLDSLGKSYSDLEGFPALPLMPDTPLIRLVRDAVLTDGSAEQLKAEGVPRLLKWTRELSPQKRVGFGRNYLIRLKVAQWDPAVLDFIAHSYGLPRNAKLPAFWAPVPPEIQHAFQKFFIQKRLRQAFGGDSDRYAYWRTWTDTLIDVHLDRAGGVDWALLRFERFGVIEFFEVGNAAYFYEPERLNRVRHFNARNVGDLKEIYYPSFGWGDNRLIHRSGWERTANEMVRLWTQKAR
jgi:hypothetical protein